jgi:hypothetical protein
MGRKVAHTGTRARSIAYGPGVYVFPLPNIPVESLSIMWIAGGHLMIGRPTVAGGALTRIDHPTADGTYRTLPEASAAVAAFIAAGDAS